MKLFYQKLKSLAMIFWPCLYKECGGQRQSPISLSQFSSDLVIYPAFNFKNYQVAPSKANLVNNGHSGMHLNWDN